MLDLLRISGPVRQILHHLGEGASPFDLLATDGGRFTGVAEKDLHVTEDCRMPKEALAGLLLYAGFAAASHDVAQNCASREGSYWHGIYHRLEPDEWNAMYWLRRVGHHEIAPTLAQRAAQLGWAAKGNWEHQAFVDFTSAARQSGHLIDMEIAKMIQLAEWQLLFAWCAESAGRAETQSR